MKERLVDRIRRKAIERYDSLLKWVIRKAVQKHDDLNYRAFMAYSWNRDDVTCYSVVAERFYPDVHILGTKMERFIDGKWVQEN